MRKTRMEKGITLVALIITIVVLLILAVVSINSIQNNGIIIRSKDAKEQMKIAQYKEEIELIKFETRLKYENGITLENLKMEFDANSKKEWVNSTEIITDNEINKIKLITSDGDIFYITGDTTEYKGMEGIPNEMPSAGEILFTPKNTEWQEENINNVKQALDYLYSNL